MGIIADFKERYRWRKHMRNVNAYHRGFGWAVAAHVLDELRIDAVRFILNREKDYHSEAFMEGAHDAMDFLHDLRGDKPWDTN